MTAVSRIGAVVIGRNEGARLIRCLSSMIRQTDRVVYVDSGSTDGSQEAAVRIGAEVVVLETDQPFTAARARNAGIVRLLEARTPPEFIQFVDGDCELRENWMPDAINFLEGHPKAAVVCGRRRERFPDATVFNRLIDLEWDTPVGEAKSCGGDALMRVRALEDVGHYNPNLIAGEEPELCVRLRGAGWTIQRLDAEMTWHDAAIMNVSQWWQRARRAGHAYAEGAALHGAPPERHNVAATRRALIWGAGIPIVAVIGAVFHPFLAVILLAMPAQVIRLGRRSGDWAQAFFLTVGKFPEAQGVLGYWFKKLSGRKSTLIEYK